MDRDKFENGVEDVQLLAAISDDHGGVMVEMKERMDSNLFLMLLRNSMSHWKLQGKKGVWIKLPIELVSLVETAVKEGFWYHHAEPHYLMLVNWIPESVSTIPSNATHRVGVGAIVLNDKRELLVVQEKNGRFQGTGVWKIPTGVVEEGEDIFAGVVREVKEETGIDTEFVEVLAFRQFHKAFFGKSDLFFVCMMRPLSFHIQAQEHEIEAAQWMPFEEFAAQPFAQQHSLFKYITQLCIAKVDRDYSGFSPQPITSVFDDQLSYLYLNDQGYTVKGIVCFRVGDERKEERQKNRSQQYTFDFHRQGPFHSSTSRISIGSLLPSTVHCQYPCDPLPPPSSTSGPLYEVPPPAPSSYPLYGMPPPPSSYPLYGVPPPPSGPSLGFAPPFPPQPPQVNCPPNMPYCNYPPPTVYYKPYGSASYLHVPLLSVLVSMFLVLC